MADSESNAAIVEFLQKRGYTAAEISRILARLADHDDKTFHDAVFDSIGKGSLDLDAIIREALKD
jgi:hypothetical protein